MDGCLVIHGLTGTPATVFTLKDALLKAGYRVSAPCLAGHGGSVEDLARVRWQDWYETVRIAFDALRRDVGRVYCVGASLGALLCRRLAIDEGGAGRALTLIGTPVKLPAMQRFALPIAGMPPMSWILKAVPKNLEKSIADPEARNLYAETSLPMIPVKAVLELDSLRRDVLARLDRIANPLLLLHGAGDRVAPIKYLQALKSAVKSDIVEVVAFPRSRHVLSLDYDRDEVARVTLNFFRRFA